MRWSCASACPSVVAVISLLAMAARPARAQPGDSPDGGSVECVDLFAEVAADRTRPCHVVVPTPGEALEAASLSLVFAPGQSLRRPDGVAYRLDGGPWFAFAAIATPACRRGDACIPEVRLTSPIVDPDSSGTSLEIEFVTLDPAPLAARRACVSFRSRHEASPHASEDPPSTSPLPPDAATVEDGGAPSSPPETRPGADSGLELAGASARLPRRGDREASVARNTGCAAVAGQDLRHPGAFVAFGLLVPLARFARKRRRDRPPGHVG
jgi:hypothetical protein